jgi:hypothetical protein
MAVEVGAHRCFVCCDHATVAVVEDVVVTMRG